MDNSDTYTIPDSIKDIVTLALLDILPVSGIYMIKNEVSGQFYIGSSKNIYSRLSTHIKMLYNKKHHSYKLQQVYNVHNLSAFSFTILEEVPDTDMLFEREQFYLDKYAKSRKLLNVSKRADGSDYLKRQQRKKKQFKKSNKSTKLKTIKTIKGVNNGRSN